jgi:hypothetical protein
VSNAFIDLDSLPSDTPAYMFPAWFSCLRSSLGIAEIRAAFEAESGLRWLPPTSKLDELIDDATEASRAYLMAFIPWFNTNVWGPIDGPESDDG